MVLAGNILILAELEDDDRVALESAAAEAGFAATVEPSAEVAIQKLGTKRFEALVVHMGTPGAALACMRARGKLLRVRMPVIGLADVEDDAHFARAYRASADEVLVLGRPADLRTRLASLPKPSIPQPGNARGDAVVADADRTRAEVIERVLRDAGFRVEMAMDGFAARLQAGRPSLKVAVVDASLDDVPALIAQARSKASRCAWVVRARPEQLDDLKGKLASFERVAVVSAYGPPEDVLFETNRMIEPRPTDGRGDARQLYGTIVRLHFGGPDAFEIGYTYNVSPAGLFVRTLLAPPAETLEVAVRPPGANEPVRLAGRVVWRREFGATKKEPVPAGFGVQITGGEVAAWAEACPRVASLRPPSLGSERVRSAATTAKADAGVLQALALSEGEPKAEAPPPSRQDAKLPPPSRRDAEPPPSRQDVEPPPREAQSSVEQMLAQVLEQTLGNEVPGSAPLALGDAPFEAPPAPDAPPKEASPPRDEILSFALGAPPPSSRETNPLDITAASLGFTDQDDPPPRSASAMAKDVTAGAPVPLATPKPEEATSPVADTIAPPPETSAELIAASASEAPPPGEVAAPEAPAAEPPEGTPWALVSSPSPDYEAALAANVPEPEQLPDSGVPRSDATLRSVPPDGAGPSSAPPPSEPMSESPRRAGRSRLVAFGILALLGGALAAVVLVPKGGTTAGITPVPGVTKPPEPAKVKPAPADEKAAPIPQAPVAAAPSAAPEAPVAAAPSAAPEAPVASAVASAPSPAPSGIASASAVTETRVDGAGEPDAAALATLQRGQGFLWVDSPLATNVYIYGNLAGTTRQRITTKCGPRFVRLGTAPGAWQSEGVVAVVKCGGFTRLEIAP